MIYLIAVAAMWDGGGLFLLLVALLEDRSHGSPPAPAAILVIVAATAMFFGLFAIRVIETRSRIDLTIGRGVVFRIQTTVFGGLPAARRRLGWTHRQGLLYTVAVVGLFAAAVATAAFT